MAKGWLRKKMYADGETWLFCFYTTRPLDGKRVENHTRVGLLRDIGRSKSAAWQEVERLGLDKQQTHPRSARAKFSDAAEHYKTHGLERKGLTKVKADGTIYNYRHIVNDYLIPRWGEQVAEEIEPLEVEEWLIALHDEEELEWTTLAKFRQVMSHVYTNGQKYGLIPREHGVNPMEFVTCGSSSNYEAMTLSPEQTLAVLSYLGEPEKTLTLLVAVTALRISEALGLRWSDVDYAKHCIRVQRAFRLGAIKGTKTKASKAPVPMCLVLSEFMKAWQAETSYAGADDYVFPSVKLKGAKPRTGSMISKTYLRHAALQAGVLKVGEKVRFGFHNLRHSLSTYLVEKGEDPKTVQGILRLAKATTALDIYTHVVPEKALAAQNRFMTSLFPDEAKTAELKNAKPASEMPQ